MSTLPLAKHALDAPVALGGAGTRSAADLLHDAALVAQALPSATPGSHVVLAVLHDRYAFAAALLGAWARGHAVALPAHGGRDTILRLAQQRDNVAVVHDIAAHAALRIDQLLAPGARTTPLTPAMLQPPELAATLYAENGSQAFPKRRSQLLDEAALLATTFGLSSGLRYASSLPPSHAYGFICALLVPLTTGGAFLRDVPDMPSDLRACIGSWRADVLVSVPAHVRGLDSRALAHYARVFCSRAPLANRAHVADGPPIIELFGSTATGSVAQRTVGETAGFHALRGVQLSADQNSQLLVDSQLLGPRQSRPVATGDLVSFAKDGSFTLRGRMDELRDAETLNARLAAEARLAELPGVRDAIVIAVPSHAAAAAAAEAQLLAAVVAPDWNEARLLAALARDTTLAVLPQRILCVEHFGRELGQAQRRQRVLRLFGRHADGNKVRFSFDWQSESQSHDGTRTLHSYRAHVPDDNGYFSGHFVGYAILPGAAQLSALVLPCVRRARPTLGVLRSMTRVKFSDRVQPGQDVEVVLSWRGIEPSLEFKVQRAQIVCASGKLSFAEGAV
jgi:3-hydroxymyristoyl/3-hydroxydecanoyl-(acyl carrier protein) dehydratase